MSLQLILGGSGSGKTSCLFERIIRASINSPKQQYIVIVPEQFTMQTQKDIVTMHPRHGTLNIDVVSFQRLAYRVFEELAVTQTPVLDDMGKAMVLRKVLANHKKELGLYQGHLSQTGFVNQIKSMISEFYQYGITPEVLEGMIPEAETPLMKQKLKDFSLIFNYFKKYIEGHFITAEEILDVLCKVLPDSEVIKKSVIALDGYTGFTPVQYRLLELCLVHSRQVIVTATVGSQINPYKVKGINNLFYMSCHMVQQMTALAKRQRVKKLEDIVLCQRPFHRFAGSPQLELVEERLFRYGSDPASDEQSKLGQVEIYRAINPALEVQNLVRQIQYLVRKEGLRYRDIAVVTGDLAGYGKELGHQFNQEQIPYFMDDKRSILQNAMVELIRAALDTLQQNFSYESVFRCLKTGLLTGNADMLARMENYVIALGIRGAGRWQEPWERVYRGAKDINLEELNEFRDAVMKPLFGLYEKLREKDITVSVMAEAVASFLEQCGIEEMLEQQQAEFEAIGEYSLAKEYEQAYDLVFDLLERLVQLLGNEVVSRKEFSEILDAGFAEISVGVIPATVDRIVIGDIKRTRLNHIQVLFLAGVNDGIIPSRKAHKSLLSDREREFFGSRRLELAPTAREDGFMQRFYLYLMMTKPEKRLILSYSRVTADGKSQRPSYLIGELHKIFPGLPVVDVQAEDENRAAESSQLFSHEAAKRVLIQGLRQYELVADNTEFQELYRFLSASDAYRGEVRQLVAAAFFSYEDRGIGHAVANALYGNILSGSVTRLEQYAACAYAHFLKYGLELQERPKYELAAVDMGNLFHNAIDLCFKEVKERKLSWFALGDEEREQLVMECVEQVTADYGNTIMQSSARNQWLVRRVAKITGRTVWALQQQICKGDFIPAGFEVSFSAIDNLKAMKISLSEEEAMHLQGRIDRLDLCEDEKHVYVKIIDYKSGQTSFDLAALYYGLQLQLVVYLDAVLELQERRYPEKKVIPAGIFYYNINDPLVDRDRDMVQEDIDNEILSQLRMNGLVNSELEVIGHMDREIETASQVIPVAMKDGLIQEARSSVATRERFQALQDYVYESIKSAGREILGGDTGIHPYKYGKRTACDYCPYHAVCGFERKLDGYDFHRLKDKKAAEIWEKIEETQDRQMKG